MPGDDYLALAKKIGAMKLYGQSKLVRKIKPTRPSSQISAVVSNFSHYRVISSTRMNSLGDMAAKALYPSPYTQETSSRNRSVTVVWP
jgi:hypothetical protein